MSAYLIFAGWSFYPRGGWDDFLGGEDDVEAAKDLADAAIEDGEDWAHVVHAPSQKIVYRPRRQTLERG